MLHAIWHNFLMGDPTTLGLMSGFAGSVLVTLFGLPPIGLLNQGMYVEIEVTAAMRRSMYIARIGLLLIALGFILQLAAIHQAG